MEQATSTVASTESRIPALEAQVASAMPYTRVPASGRLSTAFSPTSVRNRDGEDTEHIPSNVRPPRSTRKAAERGASCNPSRLSLIHIFMMASMGMEDSFPGASAR